MIVGAAIHSVRAVPPSDMAAVVDWADTHGAPLHVHSSEQTAEVDECVAVHHRTPTALLRDNGVLGPRTTAVHATHLTDQDIADMDRTATGVCFCPTTERDLGDGIGPAAALLAGAGLFSLGSDSHAVIDLFEEARAVELDERLARRERGIISATTLLDAATSAGQRALGWTDAGALRVGAHADLVAVDTRSMRTAGGGATAENVVFAASAADVTDVIVDGRTVVTEGTAHGDPRHRRRPRTGHRGIAMTILYDNIGELVTNDPSQGDGSALGIHKNGAIVVDGDRVAWVGPKDSAPAAEHRVDCGNRSVIPGFVDSHAHLVFAGDRSAEFAARMSGEPYDGGGIATTVSATRAADDAALAANLARLAGELAPRWRHHLRDQERLRADRPSTNCVRWRSPLARPRRPPFSARTSCPPSTAIVATTTSAWWRATC